MCSNDDNLVFDFRVMPLCAFVRVYVICLDERSEAVKRIPQIIIIRSEESKSLYYVTICGAGPAFLHTRSSPMPYFR